MSAVSIYLGNFYKLMEADDTIEIVQAANPDGLNGIDAVNSSATGLQSASYNVMGQKVSADSKGIVIREGKKFFNK